MAEQSKLSRLIRLLTRDIWVEDFSAESSRQRGVVAATRWLYLVGYGFLRDRCLLRAAALSYTTTLSIAPFLAVAFTISKALGVQNASAVREFLLKFTAGRTELVDKFLDYINTTDVDTLGYAGSVLLLLSVISLLGTIEAAFNQIWGVAKGRSLWRKFTDYFSVTLLCPLLLLMGLSITVSLQNETVVQKLLEYSAFNYLYIVLLKAMPYVFMWLALGLLYAFIPNTRVNPLSALAGGVVAGTLWQVAQWAFVSFQIGVAKYNAIYGSFSQFPLFLLWLYLSWVILLVGAEISFSLQNIATFESEVRAERVSFHGRAKIAVLASLFLGRALLRGDPPPGNEWMAGELDVPVKVVNEVMETLSKSGIVARLESDGPVSYALTVDPRRVRVSGVIKAMMGAEGDGDEAERIDPGYRFVEEVIEGLYKAAARGEADPTLAGLDEAHCGDAGCREGIPADTRAA
ncbi:YihY/virulence factor BrkB family protein [Desulfohalovibrio reitneri]|uniref:YihY/virulence factor BrkB family protein n=1 Tax=Desulfohalovibrio reitneri TaxID=1307759 RepID=UPI00068996D6|nr:YihY/virulence factor BrkB family protein [Desulfohalovibrio reitneri]